MVLLFANDPGYVIHYSYQDGLQGCPERKPTETSQMNGAGGRVPAGEQWRVTTNGPGFFWGV